MKRLIVFAAVAAVLGMAAITAGCGGTASSRIRAYISNSAGTGFTVYTVNNNGSLTLSDISPQTVQAAPLMMQITPNGKWAYFLDTAGDLTGQIAGNPFVVHTGDNIYAYTHSGNGILNTLIDSYPLAGKGASLVVSANSQFLYVALPDLAVPSNSRLAIYSIDQATGILTQVGSALSIGFSVTQLRIAPDGSVLYGLAPTQQTVVSWRLSSISGAATQADTASVGIDPEYMILSANGSYLYVLDATGTAPNTPNVAGGAPGDSPVFYGYTTDSSGVLTPMPGTIVGGALNAFTENADLLSQAFPQRPIAGATSADSRFLFIVNQNSHNLSVFRLGDNTGAPTEVLGSIVMVNGNQESTASPFPCGNGCTVPTFLDVSPRGNALYVLEEAPGTGRVYQKAVDPNTGRLRDIDPPSVSAESSNSQPTWITIR